MRLEAKQTEKTRSSSQISGVMVSYHNKVSPQMVPPGAGRPPLATPLKQSVAFHRILILNALELW